MKRIVILCDGTWNEPDSKHPTNVVRIPQALSPEDGEGVAQIPIYVPGVGTGKGVTKVSRFLDRALGGMFGWGLYENIIEAYRHLVFLYEPGDEVFVFGFSRGAFTARSLTGFIRSTGMIRRDCLHYLPEAVARYRTRKEEATHPNSDESHEFRLKLSPDVATSPKELAWREAKGLKPPHHFRIEFLGVWDSVGALGVPRHLSVASILNRGRYQFHDADLSSMVRSARHAVALDEKRRSFEPTRWTNLDALNAESGASEPPYLEHFFLGDHGSVGGGGELTHLSSIALSWMIEGATGAGLVFDDRLVDRIADEHDPSGLLRNTAEPPGGFGNWLMRLRPKDREGPARPEDLHHSVLTRWALAGPGITPYRPPGLGRLETRIAALIEAQSGDTRIT